MLTAIDRSSFNRLFKFNYTKISTSSIIDLPIEEIKKSNVNIQDISAEFERILPLFEESFEILLLELDKSSIKIISGYLEFPFEAVRRIFPLTHQDLEFLKGKLNPVLRIDPPIFEQFIKEVIYKRDIKSRINAVKKLIEIFDFADDIKANEGFRTKLSIANSNFLLGNPIDNDFLPHLLNYANNPRFIPDGNAGVLLKIGLVLYESKKFSPENIMKSHYYTSIVNNKIRINLEAVNEAYYQFISLLDGELKNAYNKLVDNIEKYDNLDIFKIAYFYISIKDHLQKNEHDLVSVAQMIYEESRKDPVTIYHVLILLGYTFSFENLYESIHILSSAPVIKDKFEFTRPKTEFKPSIETYVETVKEEIITESEISSDEEIQSTEEDINSTKEGLEGTDDIEKTSKETENEGDLLYEINKVYQNIGKNDLFTSQMESNNEPQKSFQELKKYIESFTKTESKQWIKFLEKYFSPEQLVKFSELNNCISNASAKEYSKLEKKLNAIEDFFKY